VNSGAASRRSTKTRARKLSVPDPRGAVLASRWLRDGRTPGWARKHAPTGWARALAEPARYGWNAEDLNVIITDWATDTGQIAAPDTPVAFLRWLLRRHDLAFSPTLLAHARRDQERAAAQEQRERAAQELARSAQARATARADLTGPGHRLARQVLAQALEARRNARPPRSGPSTRRGPPRWTVPGAGGDPPTRGAPAGSPSAGW